MATKTIVSDGQGMTVTHLDAAYGGVETPIMQVDGTTGDLTMTASDGTVVFDKCKVTAGCRDFAGDA